MGAWEALPQEAQLARPLASYGRPSRRSTAMREAHCQSHGRPLLASKRPPADVTFDLLEIAHGAFAAVILFCSLPIHFSVEFIDEGRDQLRPHQLVP